MTQPLVKEEIHKLVDSLPEGATMEDLQYLLYVRSEVEAGRRSAREGVGASVNDVRKKYGLDPLP